MHAINWIAVIASTFTAFVLGGLWYGPLFSKPWMREMGVDRNFKQRTARPVLFGLAITLNFVAALVFSVFLGSAPTLLRALSAGAAVGMAWVAPSMVIAYLFADRSLTLASIDAGYAIVEFVLFGAIFFMLR